MHQPIPEVTREDMLRLIKRDFAPEHWRSVEKRLKRFRDGKSYRLPAAILRLAAGDLKQLDDSIVTAKLDYREALTAAEYRQYGTLSYDASEEAKHEAIEKDWADYLAWFDRP